MHATLKRMPVLCVGVKIGGAELRAFGHVISMSINCCHVCCMAMDLDAKICGAETCYLGVMVHGAELRIYFLKSFEKECICEILFLKGQKVKKEGRTTWLLHSPRRHLPRCSSTWARPMIPRTSGGGRGVIDLIGFCFTENLPRVVGDDRICLTELSTPLCAMQMKEHIVRGFVLTVVIVDELF
jgi:hypothetical protein